MFEFRQGGKVVTVYPAKDAGRPIIYLNTVAGEGSTIYRQLQSEPCPDFSLVTIAGLDWNHDMAPWAIPPIASDDVPCTAGADNYLRLLIERIVPRAEASAPPLWRGLAGYSLAGLFSLYSLYRTNIFSRVASMSGSFWFPHFQDFAFSNEMKLKPDCIFFSLGDEECKTDNPYLKIVQQCTQDIESRLASQGIRTTFVLNPGGHINDAAGRTVAGIRWILEQ